MPEKTRRARRQPDSDAGHSLATQSLNDFVQQLQQWATDPANAFYLPFVLLEQTLPADPFNVGSHDFGDLAEIDSNAPNNLCAAVTGEVQIASPASAVMQLTSLQFVNGAAALPGPATVSGQSVTGTIGFNAGIPQPGLPAAAPLEAVFDLSVALSCCPSADGKTCSAGAQPSPVTASASVQFGGASIAYGLTVAGDSRSDYVVTVDSLQFSASALTAAVDSFTGGPVNAALRKLLESQAGTASVVGQVNAGLAAPSLLAALGTALTAAFQGGSFMGLLIGGIYKALVNPAGPQYLPKLIEAATAPQVEPYAVSGGWTIPDLNIFMPGPPSAGAQICNGSQQINAPGTAVQLVLSDIVITGLSNVLLEPPLTVSPPTATKISAMAAFGQIPSWPHQLSVAGNFELTVSCCTSSGGSTCTGPPSVSTGAGTFTTAIAEASISAAVTVTATSGNELVATVTKVGFRTDPNVVNPTNMLSNIDVTTFPPGTQATFGPMINDAFNASQGAGTIVSGILKEMNDPSLLASLGNMLTQAIQNATGSADMTHAPADVRAAARPFLKGKSK